MTKPVKTDFIVTYDADHNGDCTVTLTFGDVSITFDEYFAEDIAGLIQQAVKHGYAEHVANIVDPGGGSALRGRPQYGNLYYHREANIPMAITILPSPAQAAE